MEEKTINLLQEEKPQLHLPSAPDDRKVILFGVAIIGLALIISVALVIFYFLKKDNNIFNSQPLSVSDINSRTERPPKEPVVTPTPSPMPFQEMTIPYLRQREYKSSLSQLEKASENQSYTSYLTSYSSDGWKVNGLLTVPKGQPEALGWPAIVFVHGYISPEQYQTLQKYTDYVDYLARNGFVVFKIDLRGHGDSEGESNGTYYSSDYVIDTINAYTALQSANFVNPKKIGLWGHSMAGNITMRAMAVKPEIPATVIWAGAVYTYLDLAQFNIQDSSYVPPSQDSERVKKRELLQAVHGSPKADSLFWQQVAPASFLKDLKGAIQINHAVDDNVVNIGYSRNLNELLNTTSVPHELKEYPSGGHNIIGSSFTQAMQNTVSFFKKYLNS